MEEAYGNLNAAYLQIKGMVVIEGFYALVAGFVITTFVFKLVGIIKEMINEGKGFNAKHFYELGREYIFCIGLICIMPVLLGTLETVLAYGADELMKSLANGGVYNPHNIWNDRQSLRSGLRLHHAAVPLYPLPDTAPARDHFSHSDSLPVQ